MVCPRCNFPMKESDRACVNCGLINPNHPDNASLIERMNDPRFTMEYARTHDVEMLGEPTVAFYVINILIIIISGLICMAVSIADKQVAIIAYLIVGLVTYEIACLANIFQKTGNPWWAIYVPFVNVYYYFKIVYDNPEIITAILVGGPVVMLIFEALQNSTVGLIVFFLYALFLLGIFIVHAVKLAEKFNKNVILTVLLPLLLIPVIAFTGKYHEK